MGCIYSKHYFFLVRKKFEEGKKYKYLVLAVSSHGIEKDTDGKDVTFEIVWGRDKRYKVNKLLEKFKEVKEQKIFIMQVQVYNDYIYIFIFNKLNISNPFKILKKDIQKCQFFYALSEIIK